MSRAIVTGKYRERISQNLKALLQNNNLSQKDLSKQTGIAITTINCYVNGTRNITIERAEIIADYFDVSIDELLGRKYKNIINNIYREECMRYKTKLKAIEKIMIGEVNDESK